MAKSGLMAMLRRAASIAQKSRETGIPADEALRWSRKKADAVMVKPFVNHELLATVRHLLAGRA